VTVVRIVLWDMGLRNGVMESNINSNKVDNQHYAGCRFIRRYPVYFRVLRTEWC